MSNNLEDPKVMVSGSSKKDACNNDAKEATANLGWLTKSYPNL